MILHGEFGREVTYQETVVRWAGRIRDLREGPGGLIYLATDGETRDIDGPRDRYRAVRAR